MNLSALAEHGTIENRLHSASTESKKILYWVKLLTAFYEYCMARYDSAVVNDLLKQKADDSKVTALFDLLELEPKIRKYFIERISRFQYTSLYTQQDALNNALKLQPELDKKRKQFDRVQRAYDVVHRAFDLSMQTIGV
jgi:hypothetical protein